MSSKPGGPNAGLNQDVLVFLYNMAMSEPQMIQIYARDEVPQVMMAITHDFVERVDDAVRRLTTKATLGQET